MKLLKFTIVNLCLPLFVLLLYIQTNAQTDPLRLKLDTIFHNVDKSQIPTGFLDEYGAQFAHLKTYNGALTDENTVNAMAWHYIYASVYSAKIYGSNTLPSPESNYTTFNNVAVANANLNPVSLLALNYSSIKPYAVNNNLLSVSNSQFYDITGRTENPYQLNTVFAASPFFDMDSDGILSLLFKQELFINNTGKTVSNIQVNFDDGNGFVTAGWNNPISAAYTDTGIKRLVFRVSFTDASSLQCYSNINIAKAYGGKFRYQPSTETIPFNPANNNHSGGDITVQYSVNNTSPTNNRRLRKPFIVVEGFDMHDATPLLMDQGYTYNTFIREVSDIAFIVNGTVRTFNENLDDIGSYDLIFLDYRDGTDDILRNAALLEEVINWVNNRKDLGAQPNVILGISMGGLVSRYCLAKMTKENRNPQTRMLITHDSPHRGANIPLGMQYLLNDFANKNVLGKPMKDWIPLLNQALILQLRPAVMQQLIVRDNPATRNLEYNTFLATNGVYRQMVTYAPSDPQPNYTFIATSQGSQCGVPVMYPSTQMAHASGNAGYSFLMGAGSVKFSGEVSVNALPNGTGSQRITYFDLTQKDRILWIPFTHNIMHFEHYSPPGILGYDGAPGGIQSLSRGTGIGNLPPYSSSSTDWLAWLFKYAVNFTGLQLQPAFSFVPTVSALDEDNITATSLYASHVGSSYVPPANPSAVQRYIAQEQQIVGGLNFYNIEHTNFTSRNSHWIFDRMEGNAQLPDCNDQCAPPGATISGSNSICANQTLPYSLTGNLGTSTATWTINPSTAANLRNLTPNGQSVEVTPNNTNGLVSATLNATIGCNIVISKPITISPSAALPYTCNDIGNGNCTVVVTICPSLWTQGRGLAIPNPLWPGISAWEWTVIDGNFFSPGGPTTYTSLVSITSMTAYPGYGKSSCTIMVRPVNSCGNVSSYEPFKWVMIKNYDPYACTYGYSFSMSPNPASTTVTVAENTTAKGSFEAPSSVSAGFTDIEIFDKMGNAKKRVKYQKGTKKATIDISSLPSDNYILRIFNGTTWEEHKLLIIR